MPPALAQLLLPLALASAPDPASASDFSSAEAVSATSATSETSGTSGTSGTKARKGPPPEHGPFYAPEPPSDTWGSSDPPGIAPPLAIKGGAFCFIEDAACRVALIASADVGVGINVISGVEGVEVPMTQWSFRGGATLRPVTLLRKRWHPWTIGPVASFVRSSGAVTASGVDVPSTDSVRFGLLNQVWLSQQRTAVHLDFTLGAVRSTPAASDIRVFGTHIDLAVGVGGYGALFLAGDFFNASDTPKDTRLTFGFRGHGLAAGPILALVVLGLLAGGTGL